MPTSDPEQNQMQSNLPSRPPLHSTQSQRAEFARPAPMSSLSAALHHHLDDSPYIKSIENARAHHDTLAPPATSSQLRRSWSSEERTEAGNAKHAGNARYIKHSVALNDTPATTASNSPVIPPRGTSAGDKVNRVRPTTLDIPGLTKSNVSPDGRIASRDVGSKLVIVMVGMPARGKSYITKKMARYLNWLQHDTQIFNVGNRRRVAASGGGSLGSPSDVRRESRANNHHTLDLQSDIDRPRIAAEILMNGLSLGKSVSPEPENDVPHGGGVDHKDLPELRLPEPKQFTPITPVVSAGAMDQSAQFFDPDNIEAAILREQVAMNTLDELLEYILNQGGSVGILDATNSTVARRKLITDRIRERAGPDLNVLFIESICLDENLLERNMRLKLSGPDYKDKDPETSLADFKKRIELYQKSYVALGEYEEKNNLPYVQMIDVGRKVICHQIRGFLSIQAVEYLLNFNLAPRQIWITRHGESEDNVSGKLGGDSELTETGRRFGKCLARFLGNERKVWELRQLEREQNARLPPMPGDLTPPNPHYDGDADGCHILTKSFCVWTSMLRRSIQTAEFFDEDEFDKKQMRMINELNSGEYEGLTYAQVRELHRDQYEERRKDKLHYRYPGPGGEGYLDVLNRLRPVITEIERMTDHVLLIGHRSVARVLLAYFKGLGRHEVTNLDVPIGMLYCLEPKPYGVDFKAYRWDEASGNFDLQPDYQLRQASSNAE